METPGRPALIADDRSAEELAAQAAAGSSACFEDLVRRLGPRLLGYLRRCVGDRHAAEDLLQETFLRAYRNLGRFDPSRSFKAWLFAIAANLVASQRRSRRPPAAVADLDPPGRDAADPGEALACREAAQGLWDSASRLLPEGQLTALWLRYAGEMSIPEIAGAMGRSAGAVKVLLHRACRRLTKHVARDDDPAAATPPVPAAIPKCRVQT